MPMVFLANRWVSIGTLDVGTRAGVRNSHPLLGPVVGFINPRVDPERDEDRYYPEDFHEDFPDDPIVESLEHNCIVLTHDWWMCEDCGVSFPRDAHLGDEPEYAIIESDSPCVAYVPSEET